MEPTITKRGSVYHLRYTKPDGKPSTISTGCKDKTEAWRWSREYLRELNSPTDIVLMSDVLDAWETKKREEGGDITKISSQTRKLRAAFGHLDPYNISDAVDAFIKRRRDEVSEASVSREITDLRSALNWAHNPASGQLLKRPPEKIWFTPTVKKRTVTASEDNLLDLNRVIQQEEDWFRLAFLLAISTGQRKGAILDLRVERVDWAANHLNFHNPDLKGKRKGRATVLMPDAIAPVLKDACNRSVSGYVVEKNGRKVTAPILHHKWTLVRARAGLDNLWWHDLRRTWATMAAKNRVDMVQISKQLGHASIVITEQHYAHFHPDYMGKAQEHSNRMLQNFV